MCPYVLVNSISPYMSCLLTSHSHVSLNCGCCIITSMMSTVHVGSSEFLINFDSNHFNDFEMLNPLNI
jgi:hypothetical protein